MLLPPVAPFYTFIPAHAGFLVALAASVLLLLIGSRFHERPTFTHRFVSFCGLKLDALDLWSNTMFTGEVGSGKISNGLGLAIDALFTNANGNPLTLGGGLVLEVSPFIGARVEGLAVALGRPVTRITPGSGGVRFNLVDPDVSPAQAAADIWSMASDKDTICLGHINNSAVGFLRGCLTVLRQCNPEREITMTDVMAAVDSPKSLRAAAAQLPSGSAGREALECGLLEPHDTSFALIVSVMHSAFANIVADPVLTAQFCAPGSINFRDCSTLGTFFLLSNEPCYAAPSEAIGKALLQRFLRVTCARVTDPTDDLSKSLLLVMDDAQRYLTGHRDEAVLFSITRGMHLIVMATLQSEAWLTAAIGAQGANMLLSKFSNWVWFRSHSSTTQDRARALLGAKAPDLENLPRGESVSFSGGAARRIPVTA